MAIYRLLKDNTTFDPEAVAAMARAYEDLLGDLELTDRNDPFTQIVAKQVIAVASNGIHDTAGIRNRVLSTIKRSS